MLFGIESPHHFLVKGIVTFTDVAGIFIRGSSESISRTSSSFICLLVFDIFLICYNIFSPLLYYSTIFHLVIYYIILYCCCWPCLLFLHANSSPWGCFPIIVFFGLPEVGFMFVVCVRCSLGDYSLPRWLWILLWVSVTFCCFGGCVLRF